MRIGIFTECYLPTKNGVVVSIETFRKELEKQGHEFYIFAPQNHKAHDNNAHIFRYPALPWPEDYPIAFPFLAPLQNSQIHNLNLDIIHTQHMFAMGRLGLKIGHQMGIPVVHTYHTLISEYTHYVPLIPESIKQTFVLNLTRSYCNACDQIVTPSPAMQSVLRSDGVETPIEVIPTGVYLDDFSNPYHQEVLKTKWQIGEAKKILLYLSRVAREKNLDFLFEAVKRLAEKRNDFHLIVVGGGPELENYQHKINDLELSAFVTFAGTKEKQEANRFFGAADIFVFPSITETQGIVITEAMAAGIPAVAIDKMGPSDIIQNGVDGFLTPLNLEAFCAKIEMLLDNEKLREKMGTNARKNAANFQAAACALRMEELYEKTISNYHS